MSLTPKQEQFAQLVAGGIDELDAIKQVGYKASSATKQAYRMAQNMAVQNRIAELKAIRAIANLDSKPTKPKKDNDPIRPNHDTAVQEKIGALDFLKGVYSDPKHDMKTRISAALAVLPYEEAKVAQTGKKESKKETATNLSKTGKFGTFSAQSELFSWWVCQLGQQHSQTGRIKL